MHALFIVLSNTEDGGAVVHSDDLNWTFSFDNEGRMVGGVELANSLDDEGYALAMWAISAIPGAVRSFPLADD